MKHQKKANLIPLLHGLSVVERVPLAWQPLRDYLLRFHGKVYLPQHLSEDSDIREQIVKTALEVIQDSSFRLKNLFITNSDIESVGSIIDLRVGRFAAENVDDGQFLRIVPHEFFPDKAFSDGKDLYKYLPACIDREFFKTTPPFKDVEIAALKGSCSGDSTNEVAFDSFVETLPGVALRSDLRSTESASDLLEKLAKTRHCILFKPSYSELMLTTLAAAQFQTNLIVWADADMVNHLWFMISGLHAPNILVLRTRDGFGEKMKSVVKQTIIALRDNSSIPRWLDPKNPKQYLESHFCDSIATKLTSVPGDEKTFGEGEPPDWITYCTSLFEPTATQIQHDIDHQIIPLFSRNEGYPMALDTPINLSRLKTFVERWNGIPTEWEVKEMLQPIYLILLDHYAKTQVFRARMKADNEEFILAASTLDGFLECVKNAIPLNLQKFSRCNPPKSINPYFKIILSEICLGYIGSNAIYLSNPKEAEHFRAVCRTIETLIESEESEFEVSVNTLIVKQFTTVVLGNHDRMIDIAADGVERFGPQKGFYLRSGTLLYNHGNTELARLAIDLETENKAQLNHRNQIILLLFSFLAETHKYPELSEIAANVEAFAETIDKNPDILPSITACCILLDRADLAKRFWQQAITDNPALSALEFMLVSVEASPKRTDPLLLKLFEYLVGHLDSRKHP